MGITEEFDQFLVQLKEKDICNNIYYVQANTGVNKPNYYSLD